MTFVCYITTSDSKIIDIAGNLTTPVDVVVLNNKITGDLSNDVINFEIPASVPPTSIISANNTNMSASGYGGCFSTNLLIGKDTIKVEGFVRSFAELWILYYYAKWDSALKTITMGDSSDGGLKNFKVQLMNFNYYTTPGYGNDFNFTIQLKVVDDE